MSLNQLEELDVDQEEFYNTDNDIDLDNLGIDLTDYNLDIE